MTKKYFFKLYVADHTLNSRTAIKNFNKIFFEKLENEYTLEIIDVLENPLKAEEEKILATPTLIINNPPVRRFIGNLSNGEDILLSLGIGI